MPKLQPAELGFLHVVSWLYTLYYEAGRISVAFLCEKMAMYGVNGGGGGHGHRRIVDRLRTYLQHNLDYGSDEDRSTILMCDTWFASACGTRMPQREDHGDACLDKLLSDAKAFLEQVL